jgi:hypothetical protein
VPAFFSPCCWASAAYLQRVSWCHHCCLPLCLADEGLTTAFFATAAPSSARIVLQLMLQATRREWNTK